MAKKTEVYIQKQNYEELNSLATKKGVTVSAALNELLQNIGLGKSDVKPVVFHIPSELLANDKAGLQNWLEHKSSGLLNLFYPE